MFALLTQRWAFPASRLGGKGRASGHQATRLLPVLKKRIPDWVEGVTEKAWEQGGSVREPGIGQRDWIS